MMAGYFISVEGIDFTWKTPITEWLQKDLSGDREVVLTRDPPYKLPPWNSYVEFFEKEKEISHFAEAIILLAARIDNNERVIMPALKRGALVIADRYLDSWFAYQSVRLAYYFQNDPNSSQRFLFQLNEMMVNQGRIVLPDLTILISDDPLRAAQRKNEGKGISKYDPFKIQQLVHDRYQKLAEIFPDRIVAVDVRDKEIDSAYNVILTIIKKWLS